MRGVVHALVEDLEGEGGLEAVGHELLALGPRVPPEQSKKTLLAFGIRTASRLERKKKEDI